FSDCWNEEKNVFRYGEIPVFQAKEVLTHPEWIKFYHFYNFSERISLRLNSEDFLTTEEQNRSVKNTGKLVHGILAEVKTINDIEPACNKAFKEGRISETERKTIVKKLESSLQNPEIQRWFDGGFSIMNERNLLAP